MLIGSLWLAAGCVQGPSGGDPGAADPADEPFEEPVLTPFDSVDGVWIEHRLSVNDRGLTQFWPVDGGPTLFDVDCAAAVGDIDHDGAVDDLLYSCFPGTTAIAMCAVGEVLMPCPFEFPASLAGFRDAAVLDFDDDGLDDIVVLTLRGGRDDAVETLEAFMDAVSGEGPLPTVSYDLRFWRGLGGGEYKDPGWNVKVGLEGCYASGFDLLDLSGDGRNEIVVRGADPCGVVAYRRSSDGWTAAPELLPPGTNSATALVLRGVDSGAGHELFLLSRSGRNIGLEENGSSCWRGSEGAWEALECDPGLTSSAPMGGAMGSLTNDEGRLDLLVSDIGAEQLHRSAGDGLFDEAGQWTAFEAGQAMGLLATAADLPDRIPWACAAVDLDLDRDLDVACPASFELSGDDPDSRFVLYEQSGGSFVRRLDGPLAELEHARGLVVADFNRDGCPDLMPAEAYGSGFEPTGLRILINGQCAPGGTTARFVSKAGEDAFHAVVTALYDDGAAVAQHLAGTAGHAGHWGATAWFASGLLEVVVDWPDGSQQIVPAPLPDVVRQP